VLESARRIWRQLILIEDAMLVYRVIRAPERRLFYIDVGNVAPEDVADYIEQATTTLERAPVVDWGVSIRSRPIRFFKFVWGLSTCTEDPKNEVVDNLPRYGC
jgi:hypothetical protein